MKKPSGNYRKPFAVFDISSSSVAGAHILAEHDGEITKTVFLASARSDLSLQEELNIQRFVDETVKHLGEVVAHIQKIDPHHPTYIQAILASPWYSSQTRTIVYKKNTTFVCTEKLIDSLIEKEVDYVMGHEEGSFGTFGHESVIIEKQLSLVKLNGYSTSNPFGKKAELLEIFLTLTIAPKPVLDRFTDVLRRAYGTRKIGFTTGAFTAYIVARDNLKTDEECVVIDVGEEVTDVAFIKDGFLLYQHSFPSGTYGLYRVLAEHAARSPHESKAIIEAYRLQKLTVGMSESVEKGINAFINDWQKGLQGVLDNGHYGFCMPEQCFITADPRFEALIVESIKNDPFIQHTCSKGMVRPVFLSPALLAGNTKMPNGSVPDMPLTIGALFVERLL